MNLLIIAVSLKYLAQHSFCFPVYNSYLTMHWYNYVSLICVTMPSHTAMLLVAQLQYLLVNRNYWLYIYTAYSCKAVFSEWKINTKSINRIIEIGVSGVVSFTCCWMIAWPGQHRIEYFSQSLNLINSHQFTFKYKSLYITGIQFTIIQRYFSLPCQINVVPFHLIQQFRIN